MDSEQFNYKMASMIDLIKDGSEKEIRDNKILIFEIADYCRDRKIFLDNKNKGIEFTKGMSFTELYKDMLIKIAEAPTRIHAIGTSIMLMPFIADKLKEEK